MPSFFLCVSSLRKKNGNNLKYFTQLYYLQWLKKTRRKALFTALEKIKEGDSLLLLNTYYSNVILGSFFLFIILEESLFISSFSLLCRVDVTWAYIFAFGTMCTMDFRDMRRFISFQQSLLCLFRGRVQHQKECSSRKPLLFSQRDKYSSNRIKFQPCVSPMRWGKSVLEVLKSSNSLKVTSSWHCWCLFPVAQGREPFVSYEGLEQLHRFLFVLGITHVLYSCVAVGLAMSKVKPSFLR